MFSIFKASKTNSFGQVASSMTGESNFYQKKSVKEREEDAQSNAMGTVAKD